MAEKQPSTVVEGATTAHVEDELPHAATSAEDRRAAAALSSLDARADEGARADVDRDAVRRAMDRLAGAGNAGEEKTVQAARQELRRVVKVDQEDVRLLVGELELSKVRATELLRAHEGDAVKAIRAFVAA